MTYGVNISDITFYIYDIESGDEITNEDGTTGDNTIAVEFIAFA